MALVELSVDICILIFSLLNPVDIVSVRKTCRYLHSCTTHSQVWRASLDDVVHKNHIFKKSIPIYGTEAAQLEHLATSSFRFLHQLRIHSRPTINLRRNILPYTSSRLVDLRPGEGGQFRTSEVFLIPGGRFLLARVHFESEEDPDSDCDPRSFVVLFDLSPSKGGSYSEVTRCKCDAGDISAFNQSDDGQEIRVLIVKAILTDTGDEVAELRLARICLKEYETKGQSELIFSKTTLDIIRQDPGTMHYTRIIGDLVVCTYPTGNRVYVWNFVEDKFAGFSIPNRSYQEVFFDHGASGTTLIMVSTSSVFGWKIPELYPREEGGSPVIVPNPPSFKNTYIKKIATDRSSNNSYQRTSDWYDSAGTKVLKTFDIIQRKRTTSSIRLYRHIMQDLSSTQALRGEQEVAYYSTMNIALDRYMQIDVVINPSYVCNDMLLRLTHHRNNVCIVSSPLVLESLDERASLIELQLLATHKIRTAGDYISTASFDPLRARLAYICEETPGEIVVLDYV